MKSRTKSGLPLLFHVYLLNWCHRTQLKPLFFNFIWKINLFGLTFLILNAETSFFSVIMSWKKLEDKITRPCTKPIEYRETHWTLFADDKLWFIGKRGVDSATGDSMAWRETSLLGAFVTIYDLKTKKWDFKSFDKIDEDEKRREHIFAVNNKIFMLIYSNMECCNRLLVWDQNKWQDTKLDNAACKECKVRENRGMRGERKKKTVCVRAAASVS